MSPNVRICARDVTAHEGLTSDYETTGLAQILARLGDLLGHQMPKNSDAPALHVGAHDNRELALLDAAARRIRTKNISSVTAIPRKCVTG